MSLRDELEAETPALVPVDITVPEWKGRVIRIPRIDSLERIELLDAVYADAPPDDGLKQSRKVIALESAKFVVRVARDPVTNNLCFGLADAEFLARRHAKVIKMLAETFFKINKLGATEVEAEAGKGGQASGPTPTA